METFQWCPRPNAQGTETFRVLVAQFGDGFAQDAADGINNAIQSWPLQFVVEESEAKSILKFLRAHGGHRSFLWTPPLGALGHYKARAVQSLAMGDGMFTISATFEQSFKP